MKHKITDCFLAVSGMIFIISAAVIFTVAFRPLYYMDIDVLHIPESSGYSKEEILENYNELIDYNLSPKQDKLEFPTLPMSEGARIHFREVKEIFQGFLKALILSALIFLPCFFFRLRKRDVHYLRLTGVMTIGLPLLLGTVIAVNWERAFILFHELVFSNDYWLFDPTTDPIIDCLPDAFFFHCAIMILTLILVASIGMIVISYKGKREV